MQYPNDFAPPRANLRVDNEHDSEYGDYAGFWRRFCAVFIDAFLLGMLVGIGSVMLGAVHQGIVGAFLFQILVSWAYFALQESGEHQATLGKRAVGLVVTDTDGNRISLGRATVRYFSHLLSYITLYIGFLMQPFTGRKQALHDMVAGTLVYKRVDAGGAVVMVLVLILLIPGVGILAAVAIPQFGQYQRLTNYRMMQADATRAMAEVMAKTDAKGNLPDTIDVHASANDDINYRADTRTVRVVAYKGPLKDKSVSYVLSDGQWTCATDIPVAISGGQPACAYQP